MDRKAFFERVHRRARTRYLVEITDRMLKDWIDERLLPNPMPLGRKREWGCVQYRRALQICRLKSRGADRFTDLRVQLWLTGRDIAFSRPRNAKYLDVRESIAEEFDRLSRHLSRGIPTDPGPPEPGRKPVRRPRESTIIRHMNEAESELLPPDLEHTPRELRAAYDAIFFGEGTPDLDEMILRAVNAMAPLLLTQIRAMAGEAPDIRQFTAPLFGLGGDASLIPNLIRRTIKEAHEEAFATAREMIRFGLWYVVVFGDQMRVSMPELGTLHDAFSTAAIYIRDKINPWRLSIFLIALCFCHQRPDEAKQFRNFIAKLPRH